MSVDLTGNRGVRINGHPVPLGAYRGSAVPGVDFDGADELVDRVQQRLAPRVQRELTRRAERTDPATTDRDERALAGKFVDDVLAEVIKEWAGQGRQFLTAEQEFTVKQAVMAEMFGLGRLEPLLADEAVENIDIVGNEPVLLSYGDGTVVRAPRVAPTDEALIGLLQRIAARRGRTERPFNRAHPLLSMELPGGERLTAAFDVTDRPHVSIRRYRLREMSLEDLRARGMLSTAQLALLRAAVRAEKNIIVSGRQKAGKTTLLGALCREIPQTERFATLETEFELGLHRLRDRFPGVVPFEVREGNSERLENGRPVGGIELARLVWHALRMHTARMVVGEVRGNEVIPMLDAMSTGGAGSLSTVHARSASMAIERLVSLCLGANAAWTTEFANRMVAESIDLIVHVDLVAGPGGLDRYVSEIVSVELGEQGRASRTYLFHRATGVSGGGLGRRSVPAGFVPTDIEDYARAGFDRAWLTGGGDGDWMLDRVSAPDGVRHG
ncbi:CpaF family protein [Amycolatopsis aidingensis]|uniref:CpaF family protein n=1 Tax=Amycolatopsis aidingensis TaxID=2842453 RepID=UPI001E3B9E9B|nr:CpaF/VirB11 family protein [Amycolatopsis aidingensis]